MMYSAKSEPTKADSVTADGLSRFYYLDNFQHVLRYVLQQYRDLLNTAEIDYGEHFLALNRPHQALLVRLYSRRGPCIRSDKLNYPEITPMDTVLDELVNAGWVRRNPSDLSVEVLATKLTRKDMQTCFNLPASASRQAQLQCLPTDSGALMAKLPFDFLAPAHPMTVQVYLDLFFGNRYQDLSTFVVSQLGHVKYPAYRLDQASRFFQSRDDLIHFQTLSSLREQFDTLERDPGNVEELQSLAHAISALPVGHPLSRRADKLRNLIARQLERWGQPALAYSLYQQTRLPPARERTARILFNDRAWLDCYHLCLEMQREPRDESESFFAERQLPRCLRKLGLPPEIIGKPKPVKIGSLTLIQDTRLTIEQQVAATFTAMGTDAFHVENWLFNALFGLLFWDTIFMPVRGAFMHPFQIQPHDLYHAEFHPRRHAELDTTLAQVLTASDLDNRMLHAWQQHYGTANPFVGWTENGEALLARALATIPRTHLQAIFRRLLSNLRHNSSGFPDLIRFTEDGGYELIEIKGPGDQIRANQNAWLSFFEQEGIPASILRVEWQA